MATAKSNLNANAEYTNLSLSSKTIHADDYLNIGQDVAPPLHVSTTFRYNRDPDKLKVWSELEVILCSATSHHESQLIVCSQEQHPLMDTSIPAILPQIPLDLKLFCQISSKVLS
jgi:hypothetical protein